MTLASSMIRTFVPGGKDFTASKAFYAALGFEQTFDAGDVVGYRHGQSEFLLQDFWSESHAGNFMMQLIGPGGELWHIVQA